MSKKPAPASRRRPGRSTDEENTGRSWPLLLLILAIVCGVFAVALSIHDGGRKTPAAQNRPAQTAPKTAQKPQQAGKRPPKKAKKPTKATPASQRRQSGTAAAKAVAGTPYASALSNVTRQRRLVSTSLATVDRMQRTATAQQGRPSKELTKLAARLHARDKELVRRQSRLVAAARSWKAARAAAKKRPAAPRVRLTGNDLPAPERHAGAGTDTARPGADHGATPDPVSTETDQGAAPGLDLTGTDDGADYAANDGTATGLGPGTVPVTDSACATTPDACDDGRYADVTTGASSRRPDVCIMAGSSRQDATSDGQPALAPQYCVSCPRRIPHGLGDGTAEGSPTARTGSGVAAQVCVPTSHDARSGTDGGGDSADPAGATDPTDVADPAGTDTDGTTAGSQPVDMSGLCLISRTTVNGKTTMIPGNCVRCPSTEAAQSDTDGAAPGTAETLRALCLSLRGDGSATSAGSTEPGATDGRSSAGATSGDRAGADARSRLVLLCPGVDGGSYRPCAPCPVGRPLTTSQGRVVPLCVVNGGTTQAKTADATAGDPAETVSDTSSADEPPGTTYQRSGREPGAGRDTHAALPYAPISR